MPSSRNHSIRLRTTGVAATTLFAFTALLMIGLPTRAVGDVPYSQNVQAVGETKIVKKWTNYGPQFYAAFCPPRAAICSVTKYWRVSRGTTTVRLTTFRVTERIKAYDYYLLDFDVTTSSRTGSGDGGTGSFRIHSTGPTVIDRNDSRTIDAKDSSCTDVAVTMSTPWPIVTASATVGHATFCDDKADLVKSSSGADSVYHGHLMAKIRHLTMQRWVKVAAGRRPGFATTIGLPNDECTKGDGDGHCVAFDNRSSATSVSIGTSG